MKTYTPVKAETSKQSSVEAKARHLANLPAGWCHGDEVPPSSETVAMACLIIGKIFDHLNARADVFPGDANSITVTAYREQSSLDIAVQENSILSYIEEKGIGADYEEVDYAESPTLHDVLEKMETFLGEMKCSSLESLTTLSTTPPKKDLILMLSSLTPTAGFQCSPWIALNEPQEKSVCISADSIAPSTGNLRYFSPSILNNWRTSSQTSRRVH